MKKESKKPTKELENKVIDIRDTEIKLPYSQRGKFGSFFNRLDKLFDYNFMFIVIVTMLAAGTVLGTSMYVNYKVGAMNEIFVIEWLNNGLNNGEWSTVIALASGYLVARVLEAPLVGILDIGGSIMTGVGIGIPSVFLSSSGLSHVIENSVLAILIGAVVGMAIGLGIYIIRMFSPKEGMNLGTDIMMGAGNRTGVFLGPLVLVAAAMYNPIVGIGAAIGSVIFFLIKKPIVGGAIIGSMLLGIIPAYV